MTYGVINGAGQFCALDDCAKHGGLMVLMPEAEYRALQAKTSDETSYVSRLEDFLSHLCEMDSGWIGYLSSEFPELYAELTARRLTMKV